MPRQVIYNGVEYINRRHRIKKKTRVMLIVISLAVVLFVIVWSLFNNNRAPNIADYSRAQVLSMSTIAVNDAVLTSLSQSVEYDDLVTLVRNDNGDVQLMQTNTMLVNMLARKVARAVEINLEIMSEQGIVIPLGNLTGLPILAGLGPDITVVVSPNESVVCQFISEFESVGINQTRHKIYVNIITSVELIMPSFESTLTNQTQVLVCECIILGDVPQVYMSPLNLN
ncbi:MAG: sporulation protein YunB [Clostridia bacterium]|nr:sporulation protein YunB [Clostridia bacterium]